jgi:hypothetical protein
MKGKLHKTIKGQWVVRIISEETPECDTIIEHGKQLPVHPDYVKYYFLDEDADGGEVEFEIVNKLWGTNDDIISYAKLIKKEIPRLMYKDGREIRSYHSPKIDEMLKEIEEEDAKEGSIFDFVCEDPNCPHCEEDRRQMQDDDLPTTTSDLIDAAIWDLPFDDRMKVWDLIEQLVKEETSTLYTEEQLKIVYTRGYDRGIDRKPRNMEAYIEFIKQNKKD